MRENVAAGNNGAERGQVTSHDNFFKIACYMSKLYRGAIAPTIAHARCLYPDTSCYLLPYNMNSLVISLLMSEF